MKKTFTILLALALVLGFSLVATTPVAAATHNIGPGDSIQTAIDNANPGDTIMMAAGMYTQDVLLNKSVSLIGAGSGGTTLIGEVRFAGLLQNLVIKDFTIESDGTLNKPLMNAEYGNPVFDGVEFTGMVFTAIGPWTSPMVGGRSPITFGFGLPSSVVGSGVLFKDCVMINDADQSGQIMIWQATGGGPTTFDNVTINGKGRNTEVNVYDGVDVLVEGCNTIDNGYFYLSGLTNLTLKNNTFAGLGTFVNGVNGAHIIDNVFQDERGLRITAAWGPTQNYDVLVECNMFSNMAENAIRIWGYTASTPDSDFLTVRHNNFASIGGCAVNNTLDAYFTVAAEYNWWGHDSGPYHPAQNPGGTGYCVTDGVDFTPWLTMSLEESASVQTATGTGTALFALSEGNLASLEAIPAISPVPRGVTLPHGMFDFEICCIEQGATVVVTVTLPTAVPVGTVWWKYQDGNWYSLPNLLDTGDNIMVIELTDGGLGDTPGSPDGEIHDPGGPGNPVPPLAVGWEGSPVNIAAVMAPWIALLAVIAAGATLLLWRRRRAQT